jgi:hypothetical protein
MQSEPLPSLGKWHPVKRVLPFSGHGEEYEYEE